MLGGLQQASVVGHDLVLRQVQVELQRHQDGELEGDQLPAVHPEALLQFLWEENGRRSLNLRDGQTVFSFHQHFITGGASVRLCKRKFLFGQFCSAVAEVKLEPPFTPFTFNQKTRMDEISFATFPHWGFTLFHTVSYSCSLIMKPGGLSFVPDSLYLCSFCFSFR